MVNENRVVFARIQEVRLWVNRLRRFGYPKKATYLSDKLSSLLRSGGLKFTPSPTTESLASEVPYRAGFCSLFAERGLMEYPFPNRQDNFSSCLVCIPDLEQTRDQMYGVLKASTTYRPLSYRYNCNKTFDDKELLDLNRPFSDFSVELGRGITNFMWCPICGHPHQLDRQ
ncbi:MAG: hypothetical protein V3V84_07480 [Candidatus Bathyarchaeia archaeon]